MKAEDDYKLSWKEPDREEIIELLVEEHEFSRERVLSTLDKLAQSNEKKQKSLSDF